MTFQSEAPRIGHGNCRIIFLDPNSTTGLVIGGLVIELAKMPKGGHRHGAGAGHKTSAK